MDEYIAKGHDTRPLLEVRRGRGWGEGSGGETAAGGEALGWGDEGGGPGGRPCWRLGFGWGEGVENGGRTGGRGGQTAAGE